MNKVQVEALLLASALATATATAASAPLHVSATSVTDLETNAESAVSQSLLQSATQADTSDDAEAENEKKEDNDAANGVDINQVAPETYVTVEIRDMRDFLGLVEKCHSDDWSRNKSVVLKCDLDFGYKDFPILESFGGLFDGGGHTIRNVSLTGNEAETGIFGTVQNTGVVKNLNVQGILAPNDDQNKLGGIVGYNYGWIENCSFDGRIVADSQLGGIVGRNGINGTVTNCRATGTVTGKAACGGIVGYNEGTINGCTNDINVNTSYKDSSVTVDQLQRIVDKILKSGNILNAENLEMNSDTGGIAGFSTGVITSCVNEAEIGYEHVGYNVGGIVGRNSGYLANNVNNAKINGRKDVGGIVGQMQPYLAVDFAEDTLNTLDSQLNDLNGLVNTGLNNADAYSDNTTKHLSNINGLTKIAQDSAKGLADEGQNEYDTAVGKINNATATMQSSLSTFADVADKLSDFARRVSNATSDFSGEFSQYLDDVSLTSEEQDRLRENFDKFEDASKRLSEDVETLETDLNGPEVASGDYEQVENDLKKISSDYSDMQNALQNMEQILKRDGGSEIESNEGYEELEAAKKLVSSERFTETLEEIEGKEQGDLQTGDLAKIIEACDALSTSLDASMKTSWDEYKTSLPAEMQDRTDLEAAYSDYQDAYKDLKTRRNNLATVHNNTAGNPFNIDENGNMTLDPNESLEDYLAKHHFVQDSSSIADDLSKMTKATNAMMDILDNHLVELGDLDGVSNGLSKLKEALKNYPGVTGEITGAMNALASVDLKMNPVSAVMKNHGNNLYSALDQLSNEMNALNGSIANESDQGVDNLRQITSQFDTILRTLEDAAREMRNPSGQTELQDDSDADIANTFQGRGTNNINNGAVAADTNVGGITGMVGVEYDLNPETDIQQSGTTSLNYIFRAKCVIDNSKNYGTISAKNSYGGGIAGHMEMGLVSTSVNYGFLDCEGKYVGGISGYTTGLLRDNMAKCDVSGTNYIGGIAGYGVSLRRNIAMVNATDYTQFVGAIAGKVKNVNVDDVYDNYYYSSTIYGIDNVNYKGIAEGIKYQELLGKAEEFNVGTDLQQVLSELQLTFMADDMVIKTITCHYGEMISDSDIPEVPAKDGFHGRWSRTDYSEIKADEVIHAEYSRVNTLLTSGQKRAKGMPTIEVEGNFNIGDSLILTELAAESGERERWMVTIPDDGQKEHEIRFMVPSDLDSKDAQIYLIQDGKKKRVETGKNGKYLTFTAEGNDVAFVVEGGGSLKDLLLKVGIGAGAAAAAGGVGLVSLQRARRKKRRHSGRKSQGKKSEK